MYIKVTSISDFLSFIIDSLGNGEKNIRIFISDKQTQWEFSNEKTQFTYVLFTHLYQVLYSDSLNDDEYSKILKTLKDYQEQFSKPFSKPFSITRFEKIKFDKNLNQLLIENELNTF